MEAQVIDKIKFLNLKKTNIAIIKVIIKKNTSADKSLKQFIYEHIPFFSPTSCKNFINKKLLPKAGFYFNFLLILLHHNFKKPAN
ncbi:MAG TPA: hypothetical protein P5232_00870 [Candidatus Moranbacteria bacterium]|nr:hypothetical protein [Candidatus Moranbacteria bacterium]